MTYRDLHYDYVYRCPHDVYLGIPIKLSPKSEHPINILRQLCLNDDFAFYPQSLTISRCILPTEADELTDQDDDISEAVAMSEQLDNSLVLEFLERFASIIDEMIRKSLCTTYFNTHLWRQKIKEDSRLVVLSLLLLVLPRLKSVTFIGPNRAFPDSSNSIWDLLNLIPERSDRTNGLSVAALAKLSEVTLKGFENIRRDELPGIVSSYLLLLLLYPLFAQSKRISSTARYSSSLNHPTSLVSTFTELASIL